MQRSIENIHSKNFRSKTHAKKNEILVKGGSFVGMKTFDVIDHMNTFFFSNSNTYCINIIAKGIYLTVSLFCFYFGVSLCFPIPREFKQGTIELRAWQSLLVGLTDQFPSLNNAVLRIGINSSSSFLRTKLYKKTLNV